jgi:hypothetical protein
LKPLKLAQCAKPAPVMAFVVPASVLGNLAVSPAGYVAGVVRVPNVADWERRMTKKEFKNLKRGDYVVLGYSTFQVKAYINLGSSIRLELEGPGIPCLTLTIDEAACLSKAKGNK